MKTRMLIIIVLIIIAASGTFAILNRGSKNPPSLIIQEPQERTVTWSEILKQAVQQENKGNILETKSLYEKLVNNYPNSPQVGDWQRKVWNLNLKLLFSPIITPGSISYEIKSGDSLAKVAKTFNTTVELLKKSNGLSSDVIIAGRKLKVWTKPFNIVVDKSQNTLILKFDDKVMKTYTVSTGIDNSTPIGKFKIINKLLNPVWFKAGAVVPPESPDNVLGSRWMGFDLAGYGIHGTTQKETIGQQVTQGCVRMLNSEVEELFNIVPVNTEVTIID